MLSKRDIINFLFVASFPVFGMGTYIAATRSPSGGFIVGISVHLLIILFYLIDILYKKEFQSRVNAYYFLNWLYLLTCIVSLFRALYNGLPEDNLPITLVKCVVFVAPINAFIVVLLYNDDCWERITNLTFLSLSLLLLINLFGFLVLKLSNELHSIEGRLNFPFLDGFYSGACVITILNLMLIYYMARIRNDPFRFSYLAAYFILNLMLLNLINSRLNILIFLFVASLLSFRVIEKIKGLFVSSLFTVPILLSSGFLLYEILTLPVFVTMLKRVDVQDIMTFNGRAFIWNNVMTWLMDDQRGIFWGNGFKGHYFLDLISDVAKLWNSDAKDYHHMHLHSSSFEILVCQGIFGYAIFMILFHRVYTYYKEKYQSGDPQGVFFAVTVFMLFILQVDAFVYLESSGQVIFSLLLASVLVNQQPKPQQETSTRGFNHSLLGQQVPSTLENYGASKRE
ncbi:MAG: hypothetical protein HYR67_04305 [Bacteroidetes bacterium]|nr:hypothetical protein [Bacteroidota bacterium]